jgi:hypothetical protein
MTDAIMQAIQDFEEAVEGACQGEADGSAVDTAHAHLFNLINAAIEEERHGFCPPCAPCPPNTPCPKAKGFLDYWREFWSH